MAQGFSFKNFTSRIDLRADKAQSQIDTTKRGARPGMNNTLIQTRRVTTRGDDRMQRRSEGAHLRSCQAHKSMITEQETGPHNKFDVDCTRFHTLGLPYIVRVSGTGFETKIQR